MKLIIASLALVLLASSVQATDIKIYGTQTAQAKQMKAHNKAFSADTHKTQQSVKTDILKKKKNDKIDKHKKKDSQSERTKF